MTLIARGKYDRSSLGSISFGIDSRISQTFTWDQFQIIRDRSHVSDRTAFQAFLKGMLVRIAYRTN